MFHGLGRLIWNAFQENDACKEEFKKATDSTAGLKTALEAARNKLSDALVEGDITLEG